MARLDRCWGEAHAAADAASDASILSALSPEALGATRVAPHPAARWCWFADQPIFTIWSRNRAGAGNDEEMSWQGEGALLTRPDNAVVWRAASQADCAFLDACRGGATLLDAAGSAFKVDPEVDLAGLLAGLLRADALILLSTAPDGDPP